MQAVIEYMNGELETLVGLQGFGRGITERILKSHDARKIWLLQDYEDPFEYDSKEPYWELVMVWVTRSDGKVARVWLGKWSIDDVDVWTSLDRDYPGSSGLIQDCPEDSKYVEYNHWDGTFYPGDRDFLDWLRTVDVEVAEYDVVDRRRVLKTFEGADRDRLVDRAIDWSTIWIENSGCDTSELDVRVEIGDEEAWSWDEASGKSSAKGVASRTAKRRAPSKSPRTAKPKPKRAATTKKATTAKRTSAKRKAPARKPATKRTTSTKRGMAKGARR